ncbi:hypothetical protein GobsT_71180 [Gemmata obscuriglobus]|uniref:hypothetical protein n=1 Tax=Gemmata obscuriglobus TaxID=114 RepID=UPI00016C4222|nr:hypothetical protein [Gemmata obscuriglobus]QEG32265.1 hypothetical protein GobsT_71180 [Gemmata obscuriglobus]VTS11621.1 Uncharacterized protein OS=Thiorhodovibrio sp. 970 GN=Thi970DRAFT_00617 PE=4 SV=1 [Gemmata obscuriglobus UQM 2246]
MRIGFYTKGPVSLPHQPYPKATLLLIERAVVAAWQEIVNHPDGDFDITNANEDRITRELRTCLVNRILDGSEVPGFTSEQFSITREAKFESYDGTHLDDMPDIHVSIKRNGTVSVASNDGLFVECKPVDVDHPAGRDYCDKGLLRFVNGHYAWALPQALMIGYADPTYAISKKLKAAFNKRKATIKATGNPIACPDCNSTDLSQVTYITVHDRGFIYPLTSTIAPAITVRHVWLNTRKISVAVPTR